MTLAHELWPFLTLGLLGALHCAGMCGGFALLVAGAGRTSGSERRVAAGLLLRQAPYLLGKASTYAVVGLAFALATRGVEHTARTHAWIRTVAGLAAGLLLLVIGLRQLGWLPSGALSVGPWTRRPAALLRRSLVALRELPGWAGALGTGVLNGLVPCGLTWGAWLLASQVSPAGALLGCFLFGLATAPALLAVALGPALLGRDGAATRGTLARGLALALVVFGALGLWRAVGSWPAGDGRTALAPCCAEWEVQASPAARDDAGP